MRLSFGRSVVRENLHEARIHDHTHIGDHPDVLHRRRRIQQRERLVLLAVGLAGAGVDRSGVPAVKTPGKVRLTGFTHQEAAVLKWSPKSHPAENIDRGCTTVM